MDIIGLHKFLNSIPPYSRFGYFSVSRSRKDHPLYTITYVMKEYCMKPTALGDQLFKELRSYLQGTIEWELQLKNDFPLIE